MNGTIVETRPPNRYFTRYIDGSKLFPETYLQTDNIELDFGTHGVELGSSVIRALDRGTISPEQIHTFEAAFGFTPEVAHLEAHIENLSGR